MTCRFRPSRNVTCHSRDAARCDCNAVGKTVQRCSTHRTELRQRGLDVRHRQETARHQEICGARSKRWEMQVWSHRAISTCGAVREPKSVANRCGDRSKAGKRAKPCHRRPLVAKVGAFAQPTFARKPAPQHWMVRFCHEEPRRFGDQGLPRGNRPNSARAFCFR